MISLNIIFGILFFVCLSAFSLLLRRYLEKRVFENTQDRALLRRKILELRIKKERERKMEFNPSKREMLIEKEKEA